MQHIKQGNDEKMNSNLYIITMIRCINEENKDDLVLDSLNGLNASLTMGNTDIQMEREIVLLMLKTIEKWKSNIQIIQQAVTIINTMLDIEPKCSILIFKYAGITKICDLSLNVRDLELVGQCLKCLSLLLAFKHRSTQIYSREIIKSGGLLACLLYFDYIPKHTKLLAIKVFGKLCSQVSFGDETASLEQVSHVLQVLPNLHKILRFSDDSEVISEAYAAFSHIIFGYEMTMEMSKSKSRPPCINNWFRQISSKETLSDQTDDHADISWQFVILRALLTCDVMEFILQRTMSEDLQPYIESKLTKCIATGIRVNTGCVRKLFDLLLDKVRRRFQAQQYAFANLRNMRYREDDLSDTLDLLASFIPPIIDEVSPLLWKTALHKRDSEATLVTAEGSHTESEPVAPKSVSLDGDAVMRAAPEETQNFWACEACTFHNPRSNSVCEMCGNMSSVLKNAGGLSSHHLSLEELIQNLKEDDLKSATEILSHGTYIDRIGDATCQYLLSIDLLSSNRMTRMIALRVLTSLLYYMSIPSLLKMCEKLDRFFDTIISLLNDADSTFAMIGLKMVYILLIRIPVNITSPLYRDGVWNGIQNLMKVSRVRHITTMCKLCLDAIPSGAIAVCKFEDTTAQLLDLASSIRRISHQDDDTLDIIDHTKRPFVDKCDNTPAKRFKSSNSRISSIVPDSFDSVSMASTCGTEVESCCTSEYKNGGWVDVLAELRDILLSPNGLTAHELRTSGLLEALHDSFDVTDARIAFRNVFLSDTSNQAFNALLSRCLSILNMTESFPLQSLGALTDVIRPVKSTIRPGKNIENQVAMLWASICERHSPTSSRFISVPICPVVQMTAEPVIPMSDIHKALRNQIIEKTQSEILRFESQFLMDPLRGIYIGAYVYQKYPWNWRCSVFGTLGTVIEVISHDNGIWVAVRWHNGYCDVYRYGCDNQYDVELVMPDLKQEIGSKMTFRDGINERQATVTHILEGKYCCISYDTEDNETWYKWIEGEPLLNSDAGSLAMSLPQGMDRLVDVFSEGKWFRGIIVDSKCSPEGKILYYVHDVDVDYSLRDGWIASSSCAPFLTHTSSPFQAEPSLTHREWGELTSEIIKQAMVNETAEHFTDGQEVWILLNRSDGCHAIAGVLCNLDANIHGLYLVNFDHCVILGVPRRFLHGSIPSGIEQVTYNDFRRFVLHQCEAEGCVDYNKSMASPTITRGSKRMDFSEECKTALRPWSLMQLWGGEFSDPAYKSVKKDATKVQILSQTNQLDDRHMLIESLVKQGLNTPRVKEGFELQYELSSERPLSNVLYPSGDLVGLSGSFTRIAGSNSVTAISHFPTVTVCGAWITQGDWYFEVEIVSLGLGQIGIATPYFSADEKLGNGCGDDVHSWSFDGTRKLKWAVESEEWGKSWVEGDVVGCAIHVENCTRTVTISYSLNGDWNEPMGIAFDSVRFTGTAVRPTISFNTPFEFRLRMRKDVGCDSCKFNPPSAGFGYIGDLCDPPLPAMLSIIKPIVFASAPEASAAPPFVIEMLNLLKIFHKLSRESVLQAPSSMCFHSQKLSAKFLCCVLDALSVCSNSLPPWIWLIAKQYRFLIPFEARAVLFECTAFGIHGALNKFFELEDASEDLNNVQQSRALSTSSSTQKKPDWLALSSETSIIVSISAAIQWRSKLGKMRKRQKAAIPRHRILDAASILFSSEEANTSVLTVEFLNESGHGSGPTTEFFSLLCHELQLKSLGIWMDQRQDDTESLYVFNELGLWPLPTSEILDLSVLTPRPKSTCRTSSTKLTDDNSILKLPAGERILKSFRLLGNTIGKSLLDKRLLDLPLSLPLCKWLTDDEPLTVEDIAQIDKHLYSSFSLLQGLLKTLKSGEMNTVANDLENLCLVFTLPGNPSCELVPNGNEIQVSVDNLEEYYTKALDLMLSRGVEQQLKALKVGIEEYIQLETFKLFNAHELLEMFSGNAHVDWNAGTISKNIICKHGYETTSQQVEDLCVILSKFNKDEQRLFLQFITGSPRLPIGGWSALKPLLTIVKKDVENPDEHLPSCSTCQVYLKLPAYSSKEILRQRMLQAINDGQGHFALD